MNKNLVLPTLSLIVTMSVFISSAASFECAWVLWTKKEYIEKGLKQTTFWEIINAFPDHDQCFQAKKRIWQVKKNQALEDKKKYGTISKIDEVPYELIITSFKDPNDIMSISENIYCLPGTLDPRERK